MLDPEPEVDAENDEGTVRMERPEAMAAATRWCPIGNERSEREGRSAGERRPMGRGADDVPEKNVWVRWESPRRKCFQTLG